MLRGTNAGLGLFILRVVVGFIFLWHGLGKLLGPPFPGGGMDATIGFFGTIGIPMPTVAAWAVALLEALGGAALILGVAVPIVALLLGLDMIVALLKVHLSKGFNVAAGGYEFVLVLIAALACLMLAGPGIMAVVIRPRQA